MPSESCLSGANPLTKTKQVRLGAVLPRLSSLLLPALDNMPVESPETEDPDAFFEGESFLVQEAEDVGDWEDFCDFESYLGSE